MEQENQVQDKIEAELAQSAQRSYFGHNFALECRINLIQVPMER